MIGEYSDRIRFNIHFIDDSKVTFYYISNGFIRKSGTILPRRGSSPGLLTDLQ